ncbi:MAG TPA: PaaI family thioesterase [Anaeromyxobacter sp.]
MATFEPADPAFASRVRDSFDRQRLLATLGAILERVAPGEVDIRLPFREDLTQQHGFLHAGAMTSVVDTACGYAALTLMPPDVAVLTVEFKVNLLAPGKGEAVVARARVVKPGRTLTVVRGDVLAQERGEERLVATMLATMMTVRDRGIAD